MWRAIWLALRKLFSLPKTERPSPQTIRRGVIEYTHENCIHCLKCERVCPPGAIRFTQSLEGEYTYHYNPYVCIYCAECIRACPESANALSQSTHFIPSSTHDNHFWRTIEKEAVESKQKYKEIKISSNHHEKMV